MAISAPPAQADTGRGRSGDRARDRPAGDMAALGPAWATAFISPAMILVGLFLVFPALWTIYIGVTNYRLTGEQAVHPRVVGLENYTSAVSDPQFTSSLALTGLFVLGSAVIGQNLLGFFLAWVLRQVRSGLRRCVEGLVLAAWILPGPVVAVLWVALLDRTDGSLNHLLGTQFPFLLEHPMLCIVVYNTWRGTAFSMLLYGSALTSVPPTQLETARMVGASGWQTLRDVVFPHIRRHVLTNTLLISMWTANDFNPYLITGGGPDHASEILPVFIYNQALGAGELGYASAISLLLMLANLVVSLVYLALLRTRSPVRGSS